MFALSQTLAEREHERHAIASSRMFSILSRRETLAAIQGYGRAQELSTEPGECVRHHAVHYGCGFLAPGECSDLDVSSPLSTFDP